MAIAAELAELFSVSRPTVFVIPEALAVLAPFAVAAAFAGAALGNLRRNP